MKVCVVNPFGYGLIEPRAVHDGARVFGGAEVQLQYLMSSLARDDRFVVSMIVERPPGEMVASVDGIRLIGARPINARVARARERFPILWPSYAAAMYTADADVYVQRGGAVLTGEVGMFCRARRRRFAFIAAHDWDCDRHHLRGSGWLAGRFYASGLEHADLVLAQSEWQQQALAKHHGIRARRLRSGFPDAPVSGAARRHVLWVGRCVEWKRPLAFLELAAAFPDVPFVAICPEYTNASFLGRAVRVRAAALPNVELFGFVPFDATHAFFTEALMFVNTSHAEGFPNTFVQSARAGTPIVSWRTDPDGTLAAEYGGLLADGDDGLMRRHVERLLTDDDLRRRLGEQSRSRFESEHELGSRVRELADALLDVSRG